MKEESKATFSIKHGSWVVLLLAIPPLVLAPFNLQHWAVLSLFISIVSLWLSELIPLGVTGLLVPCLAIVYGIMPSASAYSSFGSRIIFLFIGVFLIAKAIEKSGLLERFAHKLLFKARWARTPFTLSLCFGAFACVTSMWVSNTAACAILVPFALGIYQVLEQYLETPLQQQRMKSRLLLTTAFGASVGGIATPIGSPPNLLALSYLAEQGLQVSFVQWMLFGLPLTLVMFLALVVILEVLFPLPGVKFTGLSKLLNENLHSHGPIGNTEKTVIAAVVGAILLWIIPGVFQTIAADSAITNWCLEVLTLENVALMVAVSLFFLPFSKSHQEVPLLSKQDLMHIDWDTILLFGGGLTLGSILSDTGLALTIGQLIAATFGNNYVLFGIGFCAISVLASEVSSNTASAAITIPIAIGTLTETDHIGAVVLAVAFASSYGFMLPVSTPPNAIAYSTGQLPLRHLLKAGFLFDILGLILITLFMLLIVPRLGLI